MFFEREKKVNLTQNKLIPARFMKQWIHNNLYWVGEQIGSASFNLFIVLEKVKC